MTRRSCWTHIPWISTRRAVRGQIHGSGVVSIELEDLECDVRVRMHVRACCFVVTNFVLQY